MHGIALLLVVICFAPGALAAEAGFDCNLASSEAEELVCADEDLATLDRKLTAVYQQAWENPDAGLPAALGLQSAQRGWVMARDDCAKTDDMHSCVARHYQYRIAELQALFEMLPVSDSMAFDCGDSGQVVVSLFDTNPPTARLWRDGVAVVTYQLPADSGLHYRGNQVEFQQQDQQVTVNWEGHTLGCQDVTAGD